MRTDTFETQFARYVTSTCPACGCQPSLDVTYPHGYDGWPEYQFICWIDNIYGEASSVIDYAASTWNEAVQRTSVSGGTADQPVPPGKSKVFSEITAILEGKEQEKDSGGPGDV